MTVRGNLIEEVAVLLFWQGDILCVKWDAFDNPESLQPHI